MKIDILTLFPGMFKGLVDESMLKIAQRKELVSLSVHNLRKWTHDRHRTADDKPYGGGAGMVMKVEPVYEALAAILGNGPRGSGGGKKGARRRAVKRKVVLMTPQGKRFSQKKALSLSRLERLALICGHYEGVDERIRELADEEISIGDYVLTGGELPACVVVDAVVRLIPGVLGAGESAFDESFQDGLLEYPHYTRPRVFRGMKVPEVLLNGDHRKIALWRKKEALKRTKARRPDMYKKIKEASYG